MILESEIQQPLTFVARVDRVEQSTSEPYFSRELDLRRTFEPSSARNGNLRRTLEGSSSRGSNFQTFVLALLHMDCRGMDLDSTLVSRGFMDRIHKYAHSSTLQNSTSPRYHSQHP